MKWFCLYIRLCPYFLIAWWLLGVRFWSQWHWFYCLVRWIIQNLLTDAPLQVSNLVPYANILVWADLTAVHLLTLWAGYWCFSCSISSCACLDLLSCCLSYKQGNKHTAKLIVLSSLTNSPIYMGSNSILPVVAIRLCAGSWSNSSLP